MSVSRLLSDPDVILDNLMKSHKFDAHRIDWFDFWLNSLDLKHSSFISLHECFIYIFINMCPCLKSFQIWAPRISGDIFVVHLIREHIASLSFPILARSTNYSFYFKGFQNNWVHQHIHWKHMYALHIIEHISILTFFVHLIW